MVINIRQQRKGETVDVQLACVIELGAQTTGPARDCVYLKLREGYAFPQCDIPGMGEVRIEGNKVVAGDGRASIFFPVVVGVTNQSELISRPRKHNRLPRAWEDYIRTALLGHLNDIMDSCGVGRKQYVVYIDLA